MNSYLSAGAKLPSYSRETGPSNPESLQSAGTEIEVTTTVAVRSRRRREGAFLKGPIPLDQVARAARLPGAALAVLLAIHHRQALTRSAVVRIPKRLLDQLGVSKDAKARAVRALEAAGLVRSERRMGKHTLLELVSGDPQINQRSEQ